MRCGSNWETGSDMGMKAPLPRGCGCFNSSHFCVNENSATILIFVLPFFGRRTTELEQVFFARGELKRKETTSISGPAPFVATHQDSDTFSGHKSLKTSWPVGNVSDKMIAS